MRNAANDNTSTAACEAATTSPAAATVSDINNGESIYLRGFISGISSKLLLEEICTLFSLQWTRSLNNYLITWLRGI